MRRSNLLLILILLTSLLACGIFSPREYQATPAPVIAPTISTATDIESTAESTTAGQPAIRQPQSTGDGNYIEIPSMPDISPNDIIQQVAFSGSGGGEGNDADCVKNCLKIDMPNGELSFFGFTPGQQVRLVIYDSANAVTSFLIEVLIEIDSNGGYALHISKNYDDYKFLGFFVYDMKGNVLHVPRGWNDTSGFDEACPGIRRTRLAVGMNAIAVTSAIEVHSEAGEYNNAIVATLDEGAQMEIVDGPECLELQGAVWWKVNTENGDSGWVPESAYSWYLEPLP